MKRKRDDERGKKDNKSKEESKTSKSNTKSIDYNKQLTDYLSDTKLENLQKINIKNSWKNQNGKAKALKQGNLTKFINSLGDSNKDLAMQNKLAFMASSLAFPISMLSSDIKNTETYHSLYSQKADSDYFKEEHINHINEGNIYSADSEKKVSWDKRRFDSLGRLISHGSTCSATCFDGEKILIAFNEIHETTTFTTKTDVDKIEHTTKILDYFKDYAKAAELGLDSLNKFKEIKDAERVLLIRESAQYYYKGVTASEHDAFAVGMALELLDNNNGEVVIDKNKYLAGIQDKEKKVIIHAAERARKDFMKLEDSLTPATLKTKKDRTFDDPIIQAFKTFDAKNFEPLLKKDNEQEKIDQSGINSAMQQDQLIFLVKDGGNNDKVHAEMRIISYVDKNIKNNKPIKSHHLYIGLSKLCCAKCNIVINRGKRVQFTYNTKDGQTITFDHTRGNNGVGFEWSLINAIRENPVLLEELLGKKAYKAYSHMDDKNRQKSLDGLYEIGSKKDKENKIDVKFINSEQDKRPIYMKSNPINSDSEPELDASKESSKQKVTLLNSQTDYMEEFLNKNPELRKKFEEFKKERNSANTDTSEENRGDFDKKSEFENSLTPEQRLDRKNVFNRKDDQSYWLQDKDINRIIQFKKDAGEFPKERTNNCTILPLDSTKAANESSRVNVKHQIDKLASGENLVGIANHGERHWTAFQIYKANDGKLACKFMDSSEDVSLVFEEKYADNIKSKIEQKDKDSIDKLEKGKDTVIIVDDLAYKVSKGQDGNLTYRNHSYSMGLYDANGFSGDLLANNLKAQDIQQQANALKAGYSKQYIANSTDEKNPGQSVYRISKDEDGQARFEFLAAESLPSENYNYFKQSLLALGAGISEDQIQQIPCKKQKDGSACGLFAIENAKLMANEDASITNSIDKTFDQNDVKATRTLYAESYLRQTIASIVQRVITDLDKDRKIDFSNERQFFTKLLDKNNELVESIEIGRISQDDVTNTESKYRYTVTLKEGTEQGTIDKIKTSLAELSSEDKLEIDKYKKSNIGGGDVDRIRIHLKRQDITNTNSELNTLIAANNKNLIDDIKNTKLKNIKVEFSKNLEEKPDYELLKVDGDEAQAQLTIEDLSNTEVALLRVYDKYFGGDLNLDAKQIKAAKELLSSNGGMTFEVNELSVKAIKTDENEIKHKTKTIPTTIKAEAEFQEAKRKDDDKDGVSTTVSNNSVPISETEDLLKSASTPENISGRKRQREDEQNEVNKLPKTSEGADVHSNQGREINTDIINLDQQIIQANYQKSLNKDNKQEAIKVAVNINKELKSNDHISNDETQKSVATNTQIFKANKNIMTLRNRSNDKKKSV